MTVGPLRIILLGPPGAGKGTQAAMIADRYHSAHVSTGEPRQFLVSVGNDGFVDVEPVTGP